MNSKQSSKQWEGLSPMKASQKTYSPTKASSVFQQKSPLPSKIVQQPPAMPPQTPALKIRQKVFVFTQLEDIYSRFNFSNYQPFPFEQIEESRKKLAGIYSKMNKRQPRCLIHDELLNLYCEKDKEIVCVACVHKDQKHRGHAIAPLQKVLKTLYLQSMRIRQKLDHVVDKLQEWEINIGDARTNLAETYQAISNHTGLIFKTMKDEIQRMEVEFDSILRQSYQRTVNIIGKYTDSVEKTRNMFHTQLRNVQQLDEVNQSCLLKQLNTELSVAEKLVKKTHQTIRNAMLWKEIDGMLEKLVDKNKKESEIQRQRQVIITEF